MAGKNQLEEIGATELAILQSSLRALKNWGKGSVLHNLKM